MTAASPSAPALKEIFNVERLEHIAREMLAVYPAFDHRGFLAQAKQGLADLSVMQRLARVSESLQAVLPADYEANLARLYDLAPRLNSRFVCMFLPHYVASYGGHAFERSMQALKYFTAFGSSEFAIRPFLASDLPRTLAVMQDWARDDNEHVRRLASEGSRPRLPWSFRLERIQADPSLAAPILERLKADPSLYVRKSVANHLNDITKDHPDWVLALIEGWSLDNPHTAWIARHALRSLIKQGNRRALAIIGAGQEPQVKLQGLRVEPAVIRLGERINLSFALESTADASQRLVVDYAIDYVKASGGTSAKVFKLKAFTLPAKAREQLGRAQHIRELTTRRHYPGRHELHILVNGERLGSTAFEIHN
ncbi:MULTISPECIES: DNA alkylation repair protein [Pseudomonas]|uniref:DNA alkylation repair protein n=1 Tax=Pseudomonas TaxID=286 RepID=UPI0005AB6BFC|nr:MULTISPECIES: DNA alkylation repair protein [Pseudomonas]AZD91842.1 DNA alkylation repair enzyme [Pseudomonas chlororaphis subsp. aureofaciens]KAB0530937.1 DNA alkylation repair protein [Pseudomonas chlororaphis subsp. aureofaciens]TSD32153.1 DNA alkylation repair protein [Pseudomonas sp. ATCC 13985]WDG63180.1 DNA alkylation repair protein [Pseudomonas chlororaphis]WDG68992.1 DNA alkylation repair protein [Pseudomonas chlororaphis]